MYAVTYKYADFIVYYICIPVHGPFMFRLKQLWEHKWYSGPFTVGLCLSEPQRSKTLAWSTK